MIWSRSTFAVSRSSRSVTIFKHSSRLLAATESRSSTFDNWSLKLKPSLEGKCNWFQNYFILFKHQPQKYRQDQSFVGRTWGAYSADSLAKLRSPWRFWGKKDHWLCSDTRRPHVHCSFQSSGSEYWDRHHWEGSNCRFDGAISC